MTEVGVRDERSLRESFEQCEKTITEMEGGMASTKDIQPQLKDCIAGLEEVSRDLSQLQIFSKNERFQELPTSSLHFLLAPAYLGVAHQNLMVDPEEKIAELKLARAYFRDFLTRLFEYEIISFRLPWMFKDDEDEEEDGPSSQQHTIKAPLTGEAARQQKLTRYRQQKILEEHLNKIRLQRQRDGDDDSTMREFYVVQLRVWAMKALGELDSIEQEIPLLEHMMKLRSGQIKPEPPKSRPSPQKPFIIARSEEQKKVFGLGYPSVPTVTVDEWYEGMVKSGRFGGAGGDQPAVVGGEGSGKILDPSDSENEDEIDEELKRARKQAWDEYKDDHRRGWGNTHNKG